MADFWYYCSGLAYAAADAEMKACAADVAVGRNAFSVRAPRQTAAAAVLSRAVSRERFLSICRLNAFAPTKERPVTFIHLAVEMRRDISHKVEAINKYIEQQCPWQ